MNVEVPEGASACVRMTVFTLGVGQSEKNPKPKILFFGLLFISAQPTEGAAVGGTNFLPPQMAAHEHPEMHMALLAPWAESTDGGSDCLSSVLHCHCVIRVYL